MDLTLYVDAYWISPYAFSCFVALEELGVPYAIETVGLHTKDQESDWYRNASLTGRVPALRHGEFWLSESSAIAEFLAEEFPPPAHARLLPEPVADRARARQLMAWIRSDLMPIRDERSTHTVFFSPTDAPLSPAGQAAAVRLLQVADRLIVRGQTELFGAWCLADSDFALMLQRLHKNGYELPAKVCEYVEAQWSRPAVQKWVQLPRPAYVPY